MFLGSSIVKGRNKWLLPYTLLVLACFAFVNRAVAQFEFVQITDPHLFDSRDLEHEENLKTFAASIEKTNSLIAEGADFPFAIVTGDWGVEALARNPREADEKLRSAANETAEMLGKSRIKEWLLLPGNNDLINENPLSLGEYRKFVQLIQGALRRRSTKVNVTDLTPYRHIPDSGIYLHNGCAFLGFNNASFKANGRKKDMEQWTRDQIGEVGLVEDRLLKALSANAKTLSGAFIFYHIPEVDDPFRLQQWRENENGPVRKWIEDKGLKAGDRFAMSGWTVSDELRDYWDRIVENDSVKGLFTGHLHDGRRPTYADLNWIEKSRYTSVDRGKLFICPPISVKRQKTACGFQVVSIGAHGEVSRRIAWYDGTSFTIDPGPHQPKGWAGTVFILLTTLVILVLILKFRG